jgi:hypothetical protein
VALSTICATTIIRHFPTRGWQCEEVVTRIIIMVVVVLVVVLVVVVLALLVDYGRCMIIISIIIINHPSTEIITIVITSFKE